MLHLFSEFWHNCFAVFPIKKSTNALLTICKQTQSNLYFQTTVKRHSYTFCAKLSMQVLDLCLQITGHSQIPLHAFADHRAFTDPSAHVYRSFCHYLSAECVTTIHTCSQPIRGIASMWCHAPSISPFQNKSWHWMGGLGSLPFRLPLPVLDRNPTPRANRTSHRVHAQASLNALPFICTIKCTISIYRSIFHTASTQILHGSFVYTPIN